MEHIALINQIVEAERKARKIADEAREKLEALPEELKARSGELRKTYFERAEHRIALVREQEGALSRETIRALDEKHAADIAALEKAFEEHREEWANKLFAMVTKR